MPVSIKTAIKKVFYEGNPTPRGYLGEFQFDPHYIDGTEEFATNLFMSYFMSSFHNGYMINSLNIYTGLENNHYSQKDRQVQEWYTKYLSQKKWLHFMMIVFLLKKR